METFEERLETCLFVSYTFLILLIPVSSFYFLSFFLLLSMHYIYYTCHSIKITLQERQ